MPRILIVDDSPTEVQFLQRVLSQNGYDTLAASNGRDGLSMAREHKPNLVLMDVVMPGLNGFQTTRKLSKDPETSNIPVIIVSSKDQATDRIWALRQGAREYVVKPVNESELLDKIQAALHA